MANRKGPRDVMELEHRDAPERGASRPVVRGAQGIAAAGHYLTAMSAMRMLLSWGQRLRRRGRRGIRRGGGGAHRVLLAVH